MSSVCSNEEFKKVEQLFCKLLVGREPTLRQRERQKLWRKVREALMRKPDTDIEDSVLHREWVGLFGSDWVGAVNVKEALVANPSLELAKHTAHLTLFGVGRMLTGLAREGLFIKDERDSLLVYSINPLWKPVG